MYHDYQCFARSINILKIGAIMLFGSLFLFLGQDEAADLLAAEPASDAIAIRVMANPDHYSALRWYRQKGFTGTPQSIEVDGYEAVRDGRSVYAAVGNASASDLYTNIYLISYNQDATGATVDIFSQILAHWNFNTNIDKPGHCRDNPAIVCLKDADCPISDFCDSGKARIVRDTARLADLYELDLALETYKTKAAAYPKLAAGSYLAGRSLSAWPSWNDVFAEDLAIGMPIDPVNALGECAGFSASTCWNEADKKFAAVFPDLPDNSLAYSYMTDPAGSAKIICAVYESGLTIQGANLKSPSCAEICLDFDQDGYGNPASAACAFPDLDCNDTDKLVTTGVPESEGNGNCSDGLDNDCDFRIDCDDSGCAASSFCLSGGFCNYNSICETWLGETCGFCAADGCCSLPVCLDGFCDISGNECETCADDCNGVTACCGVSGCNQAIGECTGMTICAGDCAGTGVCCGDGHCEPLLGESPLLCPADCGAVVCTDSDQDGYIQETTPISSCGNVCGSGNSQSCSGNSDCDDTLASVHPGGAEICDGKDNDCDGSADEGFNEEDCAYLCGIPYNYNSSRSGDQRCCGDDPGEGGPYQPSEKTPVDYCDDGRDNDCDGHIDSADSDCSGVCTGAGEHDYHVMGQSDCNQCDHNGDDDGDQPGVWPAEMADKCDADCGIVSVTIGLSAYENSIEISCGDGLDNDCDGLTDTNDPDCAGACVNGAVQACGSAVGECSFGTQTCALGAWGACTGGQGPVAEACDGLDNDCNGINDDGLAAPLNSNQNGVCAGSHQKCTGIGGWVNDYSAVPSNEYPDELSCDNLDNDCDGMADEGLTQACYSGAPMTRGIGECKDGAQTCAAGSWGSCNGEILPQAEDCGTGSGNGLDEDCDGVNDNGCTNYCKFNFNLPCIFQ